jgi:hypothetical protein
MLCAAQRLRERDRVDSVNSRHQIGVRVELRLFGQPIETFPSLCDRAHGEFTTRSQLDQHVHPGVRGDAAASEFGRDLASFGVEDDL